MSKEILPQQLNTAQLEKLDMRTPKVFVKQKQGRGGTFDYVEVGYVKKMLNTIFGNLGWDFETEVVDKLTNDSFITVKGILTVKDHKGNFVKKQDFGGSEIKKLRDSGQPMDIGNDAKAAAADALKKCASALGIAFDIYHPEIVNTVDRIKSARNTQNAPEVEEEVLPVIEVPEEPLAKSTIAKEGIQQGLKQYESKKEEEVVESKDITPDLEPF